MRLKFFLVAFAAIGLFSSLSTFAQTYAITNARIVTVSGSPIEKGTVVIRDGLIHAVSASAAAPADAQVFDGTGLTVYPGFFDTLTNLGMQTQARLVTSATPGSGAAATIRDVLNPSDISIYRALACGAGDKKNGDYDMQKADIYAS